MASEKADRVEVVLPLTVDDVSRGGTILERMTAGHIVERIDHESRDPR